MNICEVEKKQAKVKRGFVLTIKTVNRAQKTHWNNLYQESISIEPWRTKYSYLV